MVSRPHIEALHLVPGDGDELLMESVALYSNIPVGIMTIFEGPSELQSTCYESGIFFQSLNATTQGYFQMAREFRLILNEVNPKVVYFHGVTASIIGSIVRITMRTWRPRLISVRHHNRMYHSFKLNAFKVLVADQIAIRFLDHIVAVSDSVRETLISEKCNKRKITVIYNGLDRHRQRARSRRNTEIPIWKPDILKIIAVGKMSMQKDFETMLRSLAMFQSHGERFQLVVLGAGNQKYQNELEILAAKLNISDSVQWAGWQNNIDPWFDSADLFLHTAIDEACPLVIIEAMIHGLPIVSSNAGGCRDVLNGYYLGVSARDIAGFCLALQNAINELPQKQAYAKSIIEDVQERFSAQTMTSEYTKLTLNAANKGHS